MSFTRDEVLLLILSKHPELSVSLRLQVLLTKWRRWWWCHLLLAWAEAACPRCGRCRDRGFVSLGETHISSFLHSSLIASLNCLGVGCSQQFHFPQAPCIFSEPRRGWPGAERLPGVVGHPASTTWTEGQMGFPQSISFPPATKCCCCCVPMAL